MLLALARPFQARLLTVVVFCRAQAEGLKDLVANTTQALDISEEAARKAREALGNIHKNLNTSRIAEVLLLRKGNPNPNPDPNRQG